MKSSKQITIMEMEKGNELLQKVLNFDQIIISEELVKEVSKKTLDIYNPVPFLKQGSVIVQNQKFQTEQIYSFHLLDVQDQSVKIHMDSLFTERMSDPIWDFSTDIYIRGDNCFSFQCEKDIVMEPVFFTDAEVEVYARQKLERISEHLRKENISERINDTIWPFLRIMLHINHLMMHPELKKISPSREKATPYKDKETVKSGSKHLSTNKSSPSAKPRTVMLNGIRFLSSDRSMLRRITGKKPVRHMECWGVRGHYRHMKSGKVIYVKPYEKGKGRRNKKSYVISA